MKFVFSIITMTLMFASSVQAENGSRAQLEDDLKALDIEHQKVDELHHKVQDEILDKASNDSELVSIAREVRPYAEMAHQSYSFNNVPVEGFVRLKREEVPEAWQKYFVEKNHSLTIDGIAFTAIIFRRTDTSKELIVAFKGTDLRAFMTVPGRNLWNNLKNFAKNAKTTFDFKVMGYIPEHFTKAVELVNDLAKKYPGAPITVTGSSLGGAIAQYAGLMTNHRAYIFNSLQISSTQIEEIKKVDPSRIEKASELITVISLEGDSISAKFPHVSKKYLGREFEIPYYTDHYIPYYLSIHHTTDPILISLDALINHNRKVWYCSSFSEGQCKKDSGCVWNPKGDKAYKCLSKATTSCVFAKDESACKDLRCEWSSRSGACLSDSEGYDPLFDNSIFDGL